MKKWRVHKIFSMLYNTCGMKNFLICFQVNQVNGLNNPENAQTKNLSKHKYHGDFCDSEIGFKVIFLEECSC